MGKRALCSTVVSILLVLIAPSSVYAAMNDPTPDVASPTVVVTVTH
ncbi:hypothetical protein [Alicyclobacillus fodiniaquatilis]|jgi:hypothetical protein|uniref:Uncharacterized protein n=1 Tax=Alicyclobacillus fodiniaquatilis TaxID=1661150 RepID=A0ABW4JE13_9BACL